MPVVSGSRPSDRFDDYDPYWTQVRHGDPADSLKLVIGLALEAPDDRHLCSLGISLIAPLLDVYWRDVGGEFIEAMRVHANLRKAYSCAWVQIPHSLQAQLDALVLPEEDVGHRPAGS